jgi:hypothetical protein
MQTFDSPGLGMEMFIMHIDFLLQLIKLYTQVIDFLETCGLTSEQSYVFLVLAGVLDDHVNHFFEFVLIPEGVCDIHPDFVDFLQFLLDFDDSFVLILVLSLEE